MANIRDCIGIVNEAIGDALSLDEKNKLLDELGKKITKEKKLIK
jgi:hypothetical protein